MSGPRRKKMYEFLARRDGERCYIGGEPGNFNTLVLDHADNDNANNDPRNLHLVCRFINGLKNPRGRGKRKMLSSVYVSVTGSDSMLEPARTLSAEFKKNQEAEPAFRHWIFSETWTKGELPLDEAIDCGAATANCSQESTKRYVRKETSRVRLYEIVENAETKQKVIRFRKEWETHRLKEEKRRNDALAGGWARKQVKEVLSGKPHKKKKPDEERKEPPDESPSSESS
jgi:hypothetical protein